MQCVDAKALSFLGVLVTFEIKQKKIDEWELAHKANVHPKLVSNVKAGKILDCRQEEIRNLIRVLFLAGTKKRARAYKLLFRMAPSRRSFRTLPYNNRNMVRRGKWNR